jgi:hypothetical protein
MSISIRAAYEVQNIINLTLIAGGTQHSCMHGLVLSADMRVVSARGAIGGVSRLVVLGEVVGFTPDE